MFNISIFKQEVTSILAGMMQIHQRGPAYVVFVSDIALALGSSFLTGFPITLPSNIKGVEQREACFQVCSIRSRNKCCHFHVQGREERGAREEWAKHSENREK